MILSRLWFIILGAVAAICAGAVLLSQQTFNRHFEETVRDQTRRDRFEVELWLKRYARVRTDALLAFTLNTDVQRALRTASAERKVENKQDPSLTTKLDEINKNKLGDLTGDLIYAVDAEGYVVGQLGARKTPPGGGIGEFPLVKSALRGFVLDDVWLMDGQVYLMAARPIIDRSRYVGAIVHGKRLDQAFADKLATRIPGASLAFFVGPKVVAVYAPPDADNAPRVEELSVGLTQALEGQQFAESGRSDLVETSDTGAAVYALFEGSASVAQAGFGVARPRLQLSSPFDVFSLATKKDSTAVMTPLVIGGGVCLLLGLFGVLLISLEFSKPMAKLQKAVEGLIGNAYARLTIGDFGSKQRRLAVTFNDVLDQAPAGTGSSSGQVNIDHILAQSGQSDPSSSYFGFAQPGQPQGAPGPGAPAAPPQGGGFAPAHPPVMQAAPPGGQPLPPALAATEAMPEVNPPQAAPMPPPADNEAFEADDSTLAQSDPGELLESLPPEEEAKPAAPGLGLPSARGGAPTTEKALLKGGLPPVKVTEKKPAASPAPKVPAASKVVTTKPPPNKKVRVATQAMHAAMPSVEGPSDVSDEEATIAADLSDKRRKKPTMVGSPAPFDDAAERLGAAMGGAVPKPGGGDMWKNLRARVEKPSDAPTQVGFETSEDKTVVGPSPFESQELDMNAGSGAFADEEATMVTPETQSLINAVTKAKAPQPNDDEKGFRKLYDEYRLLRRRCGEKTHDLTFEKFSRSLRKSRAQIKATHGNVEVNFKIFEKNGKASIKASPVK